MGVVETSFMPGFENPPASTHRVICLRVSEWWYSGEKTVCVNKPTEGWGAPTKLEENHYRSSTFWLQSLQEATLQVKLFSSFHILVRIRRFLSRWRVGRGREEETREEGSDCNVTTRSKTRSKTDWRGFLMDALWCDRTGLFLSLWKERKHRFEEITCFSGAPVSIGKMEMRAALLRLPVCWRSLIVTHTHGASSGSPFHCASIWGKRRSVQLSAAIRSQRFHFPRRQK